MATQLKKIGGVILLGFFFFYLIAALPNLTWHCLTAQAGMNVAMQKTGYALCKLPPIGCSVTGMLGNCEAVI